jgi:Uma2 family endonuclease
VNDDRRFFVKTDPRKCILNALKKIAITPIIVIKPKLVIEVIFPKAKTKKASSALN